MSRATLRLRVLTMVAMVGLLGYAGTALRAGESGGFSCTSTSCPNEASCNGDYHSNNGCKVQCYNGTNTPGQIEVGGSGDCSLPKMAD
jgi:hypothetical protein